MVNKQSGAPNATKAQLHQCVSIYSKQTLLDLNHTTLSDLIEFTAIICSKNGYHGGRSIF